jgi:hypothetical protein
MIRTTTRALLPFFLVLSAVSATEAGRAKAWQQHAYDDFAEGESEGISIAADGALELAPALVELASLEAERVWSMAPNPKGGLYVGTGDSGRLFAIDDKGQAELLFDSPELVLHALIAGPDGRLYAGSAPDGLIYALDAEGQAETLLQTGSHYVWDFALVDGQLYAATGEPGQVLKVAKDGSHEVFFAPEDRHVITLLAHGDRLYAGTAGKGRIYEIDGEGRGRLLFESEQEEIHNLVAGINGEMFASAIPAPSKGENSHEVPAAVYRVGAEGAVYPIWEDTEAQLVNLVATGEHLLLSASNPARLLRLSADGRRALVVQFESFVPSCLLFGQDGALLLGGAQKAAVSILPGKGRRKGHFESAVEDFVIHARWGALEWRGTQPADTRITVQTRTGNSEEPDQTWSAWSEPLTESGQTIASPPARFIQYRVEMESERDGVTPRLSSVEIRGVQVNLKPRITELQTFPFRPQQSGNGGQPQGAPQAGPGRRNHRPPQAKSLRLVRWQAQDPNEDELVYDLYLKGEDQQAWKLVEENIAHTSIVWDTESMPEGQTQLKLVASDRMDNPATERLRDERESAPFAIDNSPPTVALDAQTSADGAVVEVAISDRISAVQKAYYTIDYGEQQHPIAPLDGVFDSRGEKARFAVAGLDAGEHVIVVRAIDVLDNIGVRQIVVQVK